MTDYDKLYIGGKWVAPATDQVLEVFSPATEERVGSCPVASPADIDDAVAVARRAFDEGPWPQTTPAERGEILAKAAKLIEERGETLNALISSEMGQPPAMVGMMQQTPSLATLNFYAGLANEFEWEQTRTGVFGQTKVLREPVGVVAAVLAWNVPLFLAVNKLSPALLAGCTVLLKPAPESPLSTHVLAEIFAEAGVPEASSPFCPAAPRPVNTWSRIPASTRSRSPAAVPSAARSGPSPRRTSSAAPSNWAASRRPSSSRTPTSRPRCRCW